MSNHIHLIVVPGTVHSIARALKDAHGRYAAYFNARYLSSGHVWQGRYYSCPLDPAHLWAALRYTERNPVRAGLVADPEDYRWSSARLHCGTVDTDSFVDAALARRVERAGMARISPGRRAGGGSRGHPAQHPHRSSAGRVGVHRPDGEAPGSPVKTAAGRAAAQSGTRGTAGGDCVRGVETGKRPVCPRVFRRSR